MIATQALLVWLAVGATDGPVRLDLAECVPSPDLVHDLVGIEIGVARLSEGDAELVVRTACTTELLRIFVASDRALGDRVVQDIAERRIALDDVRASGGARLVALNIVELVNDVPIVERRRAFVTESPAPSVVRTPVSATVARPLDLSIAAAPTVRVMPGATPVAFGARGRVAVDFDGWTVAVDGGFSQSDGTVALGDVRTRFVSAAFVVGRRRQLLPRLDGLVSIGFRGGWAWLSGRTESDNVDTRTGSGPWFGPRIGGRIRYGGEVGVALEVEGGYTASGVFGDAGGERAGLYGAWLGGALALDARWGGA
ncbi:MAG: hypothetical protein RIT81_38545 [Deltaproteobacteria bacterium]